MRLRQGRKNPLTLYVQLGDEPGDNDPCVGFAVGPLAATSLCRMVSDTGPTTGGWVREALFEGLAQHARERA